jgi:hypothetical protein
LSAFLLAWAENGSVRADDWVAYALVAGLVLATVLLAAPPVRLPPPGRIGLAGLVALAVWQAISAAWSPVPDQARDEALLTAFAAIALGTTAVTLVTRASRQLAVGVIGAASVALAVAAAVEVAGGGGTSPAWGGRLAFPVDYPNAEAAALLVGFWPAVLVAARRSAPVLVRAAALAGAAITAAGWLFAQSKGAGIGLAVSGIVVLALSPARLRLVPPLVLALAPVAVAYRPITAGYRADFTAGFDDAFRRGGWAMLVVGAVGLALGLAYALVDRAVEPDERARRAAGRACAAAVVVAVLAGLAAFLVAVPHPGRFAADRWHSFKHLPSSETTSSHLLSLGSNRYDFWRVALDETARHPVAGVGGAGFQAAYLRHRRSDETPARSHSIELDLLSEQGVVGLLLFVLALGPLLLAAAVGTRRRTLSSTAALGAATTSLVHASVDWTWTFPAVVVPVFALLGIAIAGRARGEARERRTMRAAGLLALLVAVLALAPRWLSAKLTDSALRDSGSAASDLRWAKRLDPLSPAPYVAQATLARRPAAALRPLEQAVAKQPENTGLRYELGLAYERAGRKPQALAQLREAHRLDPGDAAVSDAIRRVSGGR